MTSSNGKKKKKSKQVVDFSLVHDDVEDRQGRLLSYFSIYDHADVRGNDYRRTAAGMKYSTNSGKGKRAEGERARDKSKRVYDASLVKHYYSLRF